MLFERAVGIAQRASTSAVATAVNIMRDGDNEFARLAASRLILDIARENDVQQRLAALEEILGGGEGQQERPALRSVS